MQVNKYNITNPKEYGEPDAQTGRKKTYWASVGTMTEFVKDDGSINRIIEMNDSNVQYQVFLQQPKDQQQNNGGGYQQNNQQQHHQAAPQHQQAPQNQQHHQMPEYPEEEINPEDIPF